MLMDSYGEVGGETTRGELRYRKFL